MQQKVKNLVCGIDTFLFIFGKNIDRNSMKISPKAQARKIWQFSEYL